MSEDRQELFGFERLEVWKKAVRFAGKIYTITKSFPREELFGLTSQLRRAGASVATNISEGSSRESGKDRARFYEISCGSLYEIVTLLVIASDQDFLPASSLPGLRSEIGSMCRMLSGLRQEAVARSPHRPPSTLHTPHSILHKAGG